MRLKALKNEKVLVKFLKIKIAPNFIKHVYSAKTVTLNFHFF